VGDQGSPRRDCRRACGAQGRRCEAKNAGVLCAFFSCGSVCGSVEVISVASDSLFSVIVKSSPSSSLHFRCLCLWTVSLVQLRLCRFSPSILLIFARNRIPVVMEELHRGAFRSAIGRPYFCPPSRVSSVARRAAALLGQAGRLYGVSLCTYTRS